MQKTRHVIKATRKMQMVDQLNYNNFCKIIKAARREQRLTSPEESDQFGNYAPRK